MGGYFGPWNPFNFPLSLFSCSSYCIDSCHAVPSVHPVPAADSLGRSDVPPAHGRGEGASVSAYGHLMECVMGEGEEDHQGYQGTCILVNL